MKKLLLVIAIITVSFTANAQEVKFGPKVGLNVSTINLSTSNKDVDSDFGSRTSFFIGGMAEFKLSDKFAIQPELLYSMQGATIKDENHTSIAGVSSGYVISLDYLNIPVMAKYFVIDNLALEAGPQVGFLMSAKHKLEASVAGVSASAEENDIKKDTKSIDFGLNIGASYTLDFGLNFGIRYNLGLTDLADKKVSEDNTTMKNGVFQVSIGYLF